MEIISKDHANMAEAMLEDEYKSSHQNLQAWGEEQEAGMANAVNGNDNHSGNINGNRDVSAHDGNRTMTHSTNSADNTTNEYSTSHDDSGIGSDEIYGNSSSNYSIGNNNNDSSNDNDNENIIIGAFRKFKRNSSCLLRSKSNSSTGEKKTVAIQMPPSTDIPNPSQKRPRIQSTTSAGEVIKAINSSLSEEERLDAMQQAVSAFDHDIQSLHDQEIVAGVDVALTKHLVYLNFQRQFRSAQFRVNAAALDHEIHLVCEALECVFRASQHQISKVYHRVGTSLLQLCVTLIEEEVTSRTQALSPDMTPEAAADAMVDPLLLSDNHRLPTRGTSYQQDNERNADYVAAGVAAVDNSRSVTPPPARKCSLGLGSYDRDQMLEKVTKIIGHFARVGEATRSLAHFPGLLGSMLNLINIRPYEAVPWQARLSCLWVIANLACNTENMQMMLCTPNLVNSLVALLSRPMEANESLQTTMEVLRSRSIASRAILNLSWLPENKTPLSSNTALLHELAKFAVQRQQPFGKSRTIQAIVLQTRRHAVGAIRNLAAAPRRTKILLCRFDLGRILGVLTDAALNDDDGNVKDLAFASIHNLAIQDTAELMVERPCLVMALKNQLLQEEENGAPSEDPKSHASSTLLVLERSITPDMDAYHHLRNLLEAVNPSPVIAPASASDTDSSIEPKTIAAV